MEFIKKIRLKLGLNYYQSQKVLGFSSSRGYIDFENSKRAVNIEKLIKLWRVSAMDGNDFLAMIEKEVSAKDATRKKPSTLAQKS
ncbi:hypothetical protein H6G27_24125 [Nostoc linckia FACHB-104]|nr:hypothetical protein [Nostoc linckia FACHB-104]